jgi:hypothetical protein
MLINVDDGPLCMRLADLGTLDIRQVRRTVSGWARHIDRAFDLGLWLPAVREQFVNATVHV